jgi:hypothetical protein
MTVQRSRSSLFAALAGLGALLLTSGLAFGCSTDRPVRSQILVNMDPWKRQAAYTGTPVEHTLHAGDLVTLLLPAKAVVTAIEAAGGADPALVTLDEAAYLALSDQGGGVAFPDLRGAKLTLSSGPGTGIRRFGAARAGRVYLRVSHAGRIRWVRLDITQAVEIPRGTVVRGNETTTTAAKQALGVGGYDTLELELPGQPGDGWSVTPAQEVGFQLVSIDSIPALAPQAGAEPVQRVRLRFAKASPASSSPGVEVRLDVNNRSSQYNFTIRRQATPTC